METKNIEKQPETMKCNLNYKIVNSLLSNENNRLQQVSLSEKN